MGRTKVYCILSDGTNIYVPVKAELSPYPDWRTRRRNRPAYLGLLPNFFGGGVEGVDHGDCAAALIREIWQESQKKINLEVIDISQNNKLLYADIDGDDYHFWLVDIGVEKVPEFDEGSSKLMLSDDPDLFEDKFREMRCVLKIPICNLVDRVGEIGASPDSEALVNLFLKECSMNYDGEENLFINRLNRSAGAATDAEKKLFNEWSGSETKKAFANLVKRLAALPDE